MWIPRARHWLPLFLFAASLHAEKPGMTTRVFKLQPDMGGGCLPPAEATAPQSDAAKKILEAVGVSFAEGASATFDSKRNLLTVTNTSRELGLVASYLDTFEQTPGQGNRLHGHGHRGSWRAHS